MLALVVNGSGCGLSQRAPELAEIIRLKCKRLEIIKRFFVAFYRSYFNKYNY